MAGMMPLGRVYNIVGTASGVAIALNGASAISFYGTNDGTYTITVATTFSGTPVALGNVITTYWTNADNGVGTGAWAKQTQAGSNAVVVATDIAVHFTVFGSQLADPRAYVICTKTATNDGNPSCLAIVHDLTVQRTPANLAILSA